MLTARTGVRRLRTCGGWRPARPIRAPASAPEPVEGLALYEITQANCATRVAPRTHRHPQTVMEWVHIYNERGPAALAYRRTGGRPPFCPRIAAELDAVLRAGQGTAAIPPVAGADPPPRWTLRRLVGWVRERFGILIVARRSGGPASLGSVLEEGQEAARSGRSRKAASLRRTGARPAGRRSTRPLPAGLLGRGAYPSGSRSWLWLVAAWPALLGHLPLTGPVGQALLLSYFPQLVVGRIGESVQTQRHEHGSSGGRTAPNG
jgi:transposase